MINHVVALGAVHSDTIAHAAETIRPETSTPARLQARAGGVAANVARALIKLGVKTTLIGAVGDDGAARSLSDQFAEENLAFRPVIRPGYATGQYLALHNPDGSLAAACVDDRVLSMAPPDLFDDVLDRLEAGQGEDKIWFLDANLPEEMLIHLAGRFGAARLLANAVSDAKAVRLRPLLDKLHCLFVNAGEASSLTGQKPGADPDSLAAALSATGLQRFVLTSGADDLIVKDGTDFTRFTPAKVNVVDVTGAGDALTAGCLAALARGRTLKEAVPFGLKAAELTLQSTGALPETLAWQALDQI